MAKPTPVDQISLPVARYLALRAQRLEVGHNRKRDASKDAILETVRAVGVIQLDSISVVSRAHETAIWSRVGKYRAKDYSALHYPDRHFFEYWAHAASLLPIEVFPYIRRNMNRFRAKYANGPGDWGYDNRALLDSVKSTIERDGPASTRVFERPDDIKRNPWDWFGGKPAKMALDYLWWMGELVVQERIGFERVYDITERAMPGAMDQPLPDEWEEQRLFVQSALSALGITTSSWLSDYYRGIGGRYVSTAVAEEHLTQMIDQGLVLPVNLEEQKAVAWLDSALLPVLQEFRAGDAKPVARTLLTPFDNLLWRRERAQALFGFNYLIESYTVPEKRIYGYHTLPILIDGKLVGRLDPKLKRKEGVLSIESIHLEPGIRPTIKLANEISGALKNFNHFLGAKRVAVRKASPDAFGAVLANALADREMLAE